MSCYCLAVLRNWCLMYEYTYFALHYVDTVRFNVCIDITIPRLTQNLYGCNCRAIDASLQRMPQISSEADFGYSVCDYTVSQKRPTFDLL